MLTLFQLICMYALLYMFMLYLHGKSTPSVHKPEVWHLIADSAIVVNRFRLTTVMTKTIFLLHRMYPHLVYIPWEWYTRVHFYTSRSDCHTAHTILVWYYTHEKWIDGQRMAGSNSTYDQTMIIHRTIF